MNLFLTIDLEDWFQVENLKGIFSYQDWDSCQVRVGENVKKILDLLDRYDTKATFFVLAWLAERFPDIVRERYIRGAMRWPVMVMDIGWLLLVLFIGLVIGIGTDER